MPAAPRRNNEPIGAARRRRGWAAVVVLASCLTAPAVTAAAGSAEQERAAARADLLVELAEASPELPVAVGAVVSSQLDTLPRETVGSYARIVADAAGEIRRRRLSEGERRLIAARSRAAERARVTRGIDERIVSGDRSVLGGEARRDDETLEELRERLALIDSIAETEIVVAERAALTHPETTVVYRRALPGPDAFAEEIGASILIYLTVEPVDELLLVTVRMLNRIDGTDREVVRVVAQPGEVPPLLESRTRALENALAGAELAAVTIDVVDVQRATVPDARVRLNGRLVGYGRVEEQRLFPGTYRISTIAEDGRQAEQSVLLAPGSEVAVELTLGAVAPPTVTIESEPDGARVYRGAVYLGETPYAIAAPPALTEYRVVADGFRESRVTIDPAATGAVRRVLIPVERDWEADVRTARDRFYRSFGAFAVSVAAPVLINGAYQNLGGLFPNGVARDDLDAAEQQRLQDQANLLFYGYYGSVAVSAGLFTWMVSRLVGYVRVAQEYHTR